MRFKGRLDLEQGIKQFEIIPLINIIFLLLLFIIFSLIFQSGPGLRVKLPKSASGSILKSEFIEILITADNSVYFYGDSVTSVGLDTILKEAAKRRQALLIKADKGVALSKVSHIWDRARLAGITQVNMLSN